MTPALFPDPPEEEQKQWPWGKKVEEEEVDNGTV